ncbi:hypothetical protein JDV02_007272 [Purpureocillium takamizusanense]|uniref:N-acetyltransferase domain-containing protein n=1 Tax=Purpureocillium takamizusanense TaxID=2060973 RepID=A0A9Q8QL83_9HYPO|nr:uncharacterized protein JDV02_007272 [Purpureocillium takamizusanense]UNI21267.1 hypothetical protein JDV02_007272 [Purpureocillium takamizusanense]
MKPALRVEPAADEDMPRCMEIFNQSFGFVPIHELSHGADTPANRLVTAALHLRGQREHQARFPRAPPVCVKCVATVVPQQQQQQQQLLQHLDDDPAVTATTVNGSIQGDVQDKIVGYAEWFIYDRARTAADDSSEPFMSRFSWMQETDPEGRARCLAFVRPGNEARRRRMGGRPHGQLKFMCVDGAHRRQGVGSAVVRWGMDRCAELGVPAYLEASVEGMELYRRMGFEDMGPATDDRGEPYAYPAMIWWPPGVRRDDDGAAGVEDVVMAQ